MTYRLFNVYTVRSDKVKVATFSVEDFGTDTKAMTAAQAKRDEYNLTDYGTKFPAIILRNIRNSKTEKI